jgi:hypothetical protein
VVALEKGAALELDQYVRGTSRQPDHDFWFSNPHLHARQVNQNGKVVGYYYLNRGVIGPAAWKNPKDGKLLLTLACRDASALATAIRIAVPGINHSAVRFAFEAGLRLTSFAHFLNTGSFARMEQYIPSEQLLY